MSGRIVTHHISEHHAMQEFEHISPKVFGTVIARDPFREPTRIEIALAAHYGPRCSLHESRIDDGRLPGTCPICAAWAEFDALREARP